MRESSIGCRISFEIRSIVIIVGPWMLLVIENRRETILRPCPQENLALLDVLSAERRLQLSRTMIRRPNQPVGSSRSLGYQYVHVKEFETAVRTSGYGV